MFKADSNLEGKSSELFTAFDENDHHGPSASECHLSGFIARDKYHLSLLTNNARTEIGTDKTQIPHSQPRRQNQPKVTENYVEISAKGFATKGQTPRDQLVSSRCKIHNEGSTPNPLGQEQFPHNKTKKRQQTKKVQAQGQVVVGRRENIIT